MHAIVLDTDRAPIPGAAPDPGLAPSGHVVVRVEAAALNPADLQVVGGTFAGRMLRARTTPLVPGFDFAGVIEACADGVGDLRISQRVFGHLPYGSATRQGSLAERVVVAADAVARVPDGVDFVTAAATATTGSTALQALRDRGGFVAGGRVLVNGASGGVGCHAVQVARLLGAEAVVGRCSAGKMDFVADLGAEPIDYRRTPLGETPGGPFDVVLDAAATGSYRASRRIMTPAGAYVTTLPGPGLLLDLLWAMFSARRVALVTVRPRRADLDQLAGWLAAGDLRTPLDTTVRRLDIAEAFARLRSGDVRGKVAVEMR